MVSKLNYLKLTCAFEKVQCALGSTWKELLLIKCSVGL